MAQYMYGLDSTNITNVTICNFMCEILLSVYPDSQVSEVNVHRKC